VKNSIAIVCFLLSGFAGLVYEVCWIRQASLIFGSTTFALSSILAIFFAGLAGGSWLFGRIAQRLQRPLRLYAVLEIALAVFALASPLAFDLLDGLYGSIYRALAGRTVLLFAARFGLVAVVLLPPTILMGGTLPLFCRQFVVQQSRLSGSIGFLYGVNTLGAALGCLTAGFWLLPGIGVLGSIRLAAALNVACGVLVGSLPLAVTAAPCGPPPVAAPAASRRRRIVGGLFFLTGLVALGAEVIWTRFLALVVRNSVHTYTITLTVVLTGIVLGSLLAARLFDRVVNRAFWLGLLLVLSGLTVMGLMTLPFELWRGLGQGPAPYLVLMLLPAILSGAAFPLANRMVLDDPALSAASVGRMTALNTVGGIVGSLLVGFAGLPLLGLAASLRLVTGIGLLGGLAAWLLLDRRRGLPVHLTLSGACLAAWFAIPAVQGTRIPADFLAPREQLVDFWEGYSSNLAVLRKQGALQLEIDRLWQGKDTKNHQIMAAHIPMLVHPAARNVLVVGAGTGQTASRFLLYDIEGLDCVDIEPALFPFIARHFDADWMEDSRVRLIPDDGRTFLAHAETRYDLISLEVGQLFRPGVASFYTEEFYRRTADRLQPGGMVAQFVPLSFLAVDDFRRVISTFLAVFPRSTLWYNSAELLLIGCQADQNCFAAPRLGLLRRPGPIRQDLEFSQWGGKEVWLNRPEAFLASLLCGPAELAELAAGAKTFHDDRPVLAYATSSVKATDDNEIASVDLLNRHLAPVATLAAGLPDTALASISEIRRQNLATILADIYLRQVVEAQSDPGPQRMVRLLGEALRRNPAYILANRMLADAFSMTGRLGEAEEYYNIALGQEGDDALVNRGLAYVLLQTGRAAEAVPHLQVALARFPEDGASHNYLGAALAQTGDLPGAIRHFEAAVRLRPDDLDARRNLVRARSDLAGRAGP